MRADLQPLVDRRVFVRSLATATTWALLPRSAIAQPTADYAESVMVSGLTRDGVTELSIRLGRFPAQDKGSLWAAAYLGDDAWGAGIYGLNLPAEGATAVAEDKAAFTVGGGAAAGFERRGLVEGPFSGEASTKVRAHEGHHPPAGLGDRPLVLEAHFTAWHEPAYPRPGRLEMMGSVGARIQTPRGEETVEGVGAWHEQVGDRPSFAPAFTYFKAIGERTGLLASYRHGAASAWGFALADGEVVPVTDLEIDDEQETRRFRAILEDGRTISGTARRVRQHSVPIEGQRRPGTTVVVESDLGEMVGHLNDWHPRG